MANAAKPRRFIEVVESSRSQNVAKPDLGKKLTCPSCGARFYDLHKSPATCPKCEAEVEVQPLLKPKRSAPEPVKPKKPVPVVKKVDDDDDDDDLDIDDDADDLDIDDDDDDLIEDTSDLEDDDDEDVAEVKEHIEVDTDTDR
jgi:hypothetical protein